MRRLRLAIERLLRLRCRDCDGTGVVSGIGCNDLVWEALCPACQGESVRRRLDPLLAAEEAAESSAIEPRRSPDMKGSG